VTTGMAGPGSRRTPADDQSGADLRRNQANAWLGVPDKEAVGRAFHGEPYERQILMRLPAQVPWPHPDPGSAEAEEDRRLGGRYGPSLATVRWRGRSAGGEEAHECPRKSGYGA
jgi:hypothetical protein